MIVGLGRVQGPGTKVRQPGPMTRSATRRSPDRRSGGDRGRAKPADGTGGAGSPPSTTGSR